ncbi:eukaryotic translation initiation factor 2-alpha kinase 3 [Caerostris extrusa]|uniref:Eukaryotic translation initiation factor 2-alpha kinase 3 n=1 Tax=Caerostris extrusa TaxID=172846 RepID=A0AAV4WBT1_CAEEX|nr:eukaryotic translation initiation factor 2-alpha kinase 3 [Caerostris extrusa]
MEDSGDTMQEDEQALSKDSTSESAIIRLKLLRQQKKKPKFDSRFVKSFDAISILGRGGFGVVMEVTNKTDNKKYAVKRIRIENNVYRSSSTITVSSSTSTTSSSMPQINKEGDSLADRIRDRMRELKGILSCSNTSEEYISSPDDENFTNANKNVISNLGTLKVSPSSKKLQMNPLNPFSDNLDDPICTSQPSSYSDSFEEYTSSSTGACNVEKTDFGNFKSISEVSLCYDESDEPPNDVDFLPENSKCLFVKQTVHGNAIDNSNEFMQSLLNTNDIKNIRSMLNIPKDMFIDEQATFCI